jgi:hypothetical protein
MNKLLPFALLLLAACGQTKESYRHPVIISSSSIVGRETLEPTSRVITKLTKGDTLELYSMNPVDGQQVCALMHKGGKERFAGGVRMIYVPQAALSIPDSTLAKAKEGILH